MVRNLIKFLKDESGQGAAEMMLLIGGVIVITITAIAFYQDYIEKNIIPGMDEDAQNLTENITALGTKFE